MDWIAKLEDRRGTIIFLVLLLALATVFVTSLQLPRSFDSFWHLKLGQDWLHEGLSPYVDRYSFTYEGEAVRSPPIAFEAGLAMLVDRFGLDGGYFAYRLVSLALAILAMLFFLWRIGAPVALVALALPLLVVLLQLRSTVRPELIGYPFLILGMWFYYRARAELTPGTVLPIALLLLVLTNYHNSAIAYVVFFGLFLGHAVRQLTERAGAVTWLRWAGWGALLLGVGFLNRDLSHPVLQAVTFSSEWKPLISEYHLPVVYRNVPTVYLLGALGLLTLWMLARRQAWGLVVVNLVLIFNAVQTVRLVTPAGIVLLCSFAIAWVDLQRNEPSAWASITRSRAGIALAAVLFVVPLLNGVQLARSFVRDNATIQFQFPESLVLYMKEQGIAGPVYNDYGIGGYLIYHLAPQAKVYIDGRTNILYPLEHMKRWYQVNNSADLLNEEAERYGFRYAVVSNNYEDVLLMQHSGRFRLEFSDAKYSLYTLNDDPLFPALGRLWSEPECWDERMHEQVLGEQAQAILQLPVVSPLHTLMNVSVEFANAEEPRRELRLLAQAQGLNDPARRFLGHRALELDELVLAHQLFAAIEEKSANDYMAAALASLKGGNPDAAEEVLDVATKRPWYHLDAVDISNLYLLLKEIETERPLKYFETSYYQDLELQVKEMGLSTPQEAMTASAFCPHPSDQGAITQ